MNKTILILLVAASAFIVQANSIQVFNCVTGELDNNSVDFHGCTSLPCPIVENINHDFDIKFTPTSTINNLIVRASTKIQGGNWKSSARYDGLDACNYIHKASNNERVSCPLKSNVNYIFEKRGSNTAPRNISSGHYTVRWSLEQNGSNIVCYEVDVDVEVTDSGINYTIIE